MVQARQMWRWFGDFMWQQRGGVVVETADLARRQWCSRRRQLRWLHDTTEMSWIEKQPGHQKGEGRGKYTECFAHKLIWSVHERERGCYGGKILYSEDANNRVS
jgi:hypothetical protein